MRITSIQDSHGKGTTVQSPNCDLVSWGWDSKSHPQHAMPYQRVVTKRRKEERFEVEREITDKPNRLLEIANKRNLLVGIAEKIANDKLCYLNWYFPRSAELFPNNASMRYVTRYFPYAEGGPLLVDEPRDGFEFELCKQKAPILRAEGHRYLIVSHDTTLADALSQIGEF